MLTDFKDYNFTYVPINPKTKKPDSKFIGNYHPDGKKKYEWKAVDWQPEDFKDMWYGVQHEKSNIIAVDIDNKNALNFIHHFPETFSFKSPSGGMQLFYRFEGTKHILKCVDDGVVVELLVNTQSVLTGGGREVINNIEPKTINNTTYQYLRKQVEKVSLLTKLYEIYPGKGKKQSNEFMFRVAGCLVRYSNYPQHELEEMIDSLCRAVGDTDELNNRKQKVADQLERKALDNEYYGATSLADFTNTPLSNITTWFKWIKPAETKDKPVTWLTLGNFLQKEYPKLDYILDPLLAENTTTQIWGAEGSGKTLFTDGLLFCVSQGRDFLGFKNYQNKKRAVINFDSEMQCTLLQERIHTYAMDYSGGFDDRYIAIAPLEEQPDYNFVPLNTAQGQRNAMLAIEEYEKFIGMKPIIKLDNLTGLTDWNEKEGEELLPFINWLKKLRAKQYTVIFNHHSTKKGNTASGSNLKERWIDLNLQVAEPKSAELVRTKNPNATQILVTRHKQRIKPKYKISKVFIASLDPETGEWTKHKYQKKTDKQINLEHWLSKGFQTWDKCMKDDKSYSISESQWHNLMKQLKEDKTNA
tara:strand:- start:41 stop:1792 length:1752 start_codon:yes stop_codon:yes gene_type:complete